MSVGCSRDTLLAYSDLCLGNSSVAVPSDCYPSKADTANVVFGGLQAAIVAAGLVGNLATLVAIPHAMHTKR